MKFGEVEVIKTNSNYHYVEWDLIPDPHTAGDSVDDYKFYIWHSEDPASGYARVEESGTPVEINGTTGPLSYTHQNFQYNFDRERYYKVEMVEKADETNTVFSKIVYIGDDSEGYHQVLKNVEEVLYHYYCGEPSFIIKKKGSGTRCPECWSVPRQQRLKSYCETCGSSGFINGYFSPIAVQIAFDANPKKSVPEQTGEVIVDVLMARMSNYPLVKPKDIIINADDNKRYVIQSIQTTKLPNLGISRERLSRSNYVVSQILTLVELVSSDDEYFINIEGLTETITENISSGEDSYYGVDGGGVIRTKDPLRVINSILELMYDDTQFELDGFGKLHIKESILGGGGGGTATKDVEGGSSETAYILSQSVDGGSSEVQFTYPQSVDGGGADE